MQTHIVSSRSCSQLRLSVAARVCAYCFAVAVTHMLLCGIRAQAPAASTAGPANRAAAVELSEDECIQFARSMESAIKQGDLKAFDRLVHWAGILEKATDSLGFPPQHRAGFHRGVMDSLSSDKGFAAQIAGQVAAGGSYKFVRVREKGGQKTVLLRLITDAGLNYHEWLLARVDGKVLASDTYIYLSGELLSDTLRRSALPVAKEVSKSFIQRLTAAESEYMKQLDLLGEMVDQLHEGRHAEVLQTYARLPEVLRREKNVLLLRHQAASKTGEDDLLKVIDDFRNYHPDDVCLDFLLIDYYALRKEHDKALEALDRLDASVGGDPHLDILRAEAVYQQGDAPKAFALVRKANQADPDSIDPYWTLLGLAVMEKDHAKTLAALKRIESRFGVDLSGVNEAAQYAEFMQSPQGQEWSRAHANPNSQAEQ
jgi:tetratricopeptide (TPR) repeat protein